MELTKPLLPQAVGEMCIATRLRRRFTAAFLQSCLSSSLLGCDNEQTARPHQLNDSRAHPHAPLTCLCESDNWKFDESQHEILSVSEVSVGNVGSDRRRSCIWIRFFFFFFFLIMTLRIKRRRPRPLFVVSVKTGL